MVALRGWKVRPLLALYGYLWAAPSYVNCRLEINEIYSKRYGILCNQSEREPIKTRNFAPHQSLSYIQSFSSEQFPLNSVQYNHAIIPRDRSVPWTWRKILLSHLPSVILIGIYQFALLQQISENPDNIVITIVRNKSDTDSKIAVEIIPTRKNIFVIQGDLTNLDSLKVSLKKLLGPVSSLGKANLSNHTRMHLSKPKRLSEIVWMFLLPMEGSSPITLLFVHSLNCKHRPVRLPI